jgi:hypothetical protein
MADSKISALPAATLTDSDEVHVNDGGTSKKATLAEIRTAIGGVGFIPLDITSLRIIGDDTANEVGDLAANGGLLANDSTPLLGRVSTSTDKALRIEWALSDVTELQFGPVPMPADLDETVDVTIHLLGLMSGATDTPTVDIQVFDGIGDTEMGGASTAFGSALAEETVTIANANISGAPTGFFNISLTPGSHGTDALHLHAAWIEYTKKLPL